MKIANGLGMILIVLFTYSATYGQGTVSELFEYNAGALNGLNGGEGWGGAWEVFQGNASALQVSTGSLNYPGFESIGNLLEGTITTGNVRARRVLENVWVDDGQCWISFLMDIVNPNNVNNTWQGISLYNSIYELCLFGKGYGHPYISILNHAGGDSEYKSPITWEQAELSWYVIRIDMTGDDQREKCYMWRNPSPDEEPAISDTLVSGEVDLSSGFDTVVIHFGHDTDLFVYFDEVRLGTTFSDVTPSASSVDQNRKNRSTGFYLEQNYPNPFNPVTTIGFSLDTPSFISLRIYNLAGQMIESLAEDYYIPGQYHVQWNAAKHPSGVYFYELKTEEYSERRKLVLQK